MFNSDINKLKISFVKTISIITNVKVTLLQKLLIEFQ